MKLHFTQIDPPPPSLAVALSEKGWQPAHLCFRRVVDAADVNWDLTDVDAVVITSKYAARRFLRAAPVAEAPPLAVVGKATSAFFPADRLLFPDNPPANAAELHKRLVERLRPGARLVFFSGEKTAGAFAEAGPELSVERRVIYRTERLFRQQDQHQRTPDGMVYFQAPSTVADYARVFPHRPSLIAAVGPSTAAALSARGWQVDFQPQRPENTAFINEIPPTEFFKRKGTP